MPPASLCPTCGSTLDLAPGGGAFCSQCLMGSALAPASEEPTPTSASLTLPREFGDYVLLEEIGRGGMGVVYRARQRALDRIVAVKLLLSGAYSSELALRRFRLEAAAAAGLQHPNIVAIHDSGEHDGQPFFAMDLVEGGDLAARCNGRPLPVPEAAEIVRALADAVHYAHGRGILHRDLKPSNVLIEPAGDRPRITDFGLARRLDREDGVTLTGQMLGSPSYAAPEQITASGEQVGVATDVYGIGALCYHLVTGRAPFNAATATETLRLVLETDPPPPRLLNPALPRDLETIVLKCLAKDPARRYASAAELSEDLNRFLTHRPIRARPVGRAERLWRWCRRRPAIAGLSAATSLLVLAVAVGSPIAALRIRAERERAEDNLYAADMNLVQQALAQSSRGQARGLLERHRPVPGEVDRRGFEWRYLWALSESDEREILRGNAGERTIVAIPGTTLIAADNTVWDTSSPARPVFTLPSDSNWMAFDAAGEALFSGGNSGLVSWSTATWQPRELVAGESVHAVALSADGRWMATGGEQLRLWARDESSWRRVASRPRAFTVWHNEQTLAFSPDGTLLVSGTGETWANRCVLELWSVPDLEILPGLPDAPRDALSLAFSPDGRRLVTGCWSGRIRVWNLDSREEIDSTMHHHGFVTGLEFSPADPDVFATAASDRTVRLWNLRAGAELVALQGPLNTLWALTFTDAGDTLLTLERGGRIAAWDTAMRRRQGALIARGPCTLPLGFSADGGTLVTMDEAGALRWWDVARCRELEALRRTLDLTGVFSRDFETIAPVITRDLATLAIGMIDGRVQLWHLPTRTAHTWNAHAQFMRNLAFSPDGGTLATVANDGILKLWNVASRALLAETGISGRLAWEDYPVPLAWSADGRVIAVASMTAIMLHDGAGGRLLRTLDPGGLVTSMRFSPDDRVLVSAADDFQLEFWDPRSGALVDRIPTSHQAAVYDICFSPDGRTLATVVDQVKLWSLATRQEVSTLRGHEHNIFAALFSPDGNLLVSADYEGSVRLWSAPPFEAIDGRQR